MEAMARPKRGKKNKGKPSKAAKMEKKSKKEKTANKGKTPGQKRKQVMAKSSGKKRRS